MVVILQFGKAKRQYNCRPGLGLRVSTVTYGSV